MRDEADALGAWAEVAMCFCVFFLVAWSSGEVDVGREKGWTRSCDWR